MAQSRNGKRTGRLAASTLAASSALDSMWDAVDRIKSEVLGNLEPTRPVGGVTVREYAERYEISKDAASAQLQRIVKAGKMRMCYVSLPNSAGQIHKTLVFAPVCK